MCVGRRCSLDPWLELSCGHKPPAHCRASEHQAGGLREGRSQGQLLATSGNRSQSQQGLRRMWWSLLGLGFPVFDTAVSPRRSETGPPRLPAPTISSSQLSALEGPDSLGETLLDQIHRISSKRKRSKTFS